MATKEEMIKWIDNASLEELLRRWRFAPPGDPIFQGEVGAYLMDMISKKRTEDPEEYVRISKKIG